MEILKKRRERFDAAIKMFKKNKIKAYEMRQKAIEQYADTPEAQRGERLLVQWKPIIAKEKAEQKAANERWRKHMEWREDVRRRTGRYPCPVCNGSGRGSAGYGQSGSVCSSCEGSGLER